MDKIVKEAVMKRLVVFLSLVIIAALGAYFISSYLNEQQETEIYTENAQSYTVVFDIQTKKGFVYRNDGDTSEVIIIHAEKNVGFVYSDQGQSIVKYDKYLKWLNDHKKSTVYNSVVALIAPPR